MAKDKVSQFASRLRELGLKPYTELLSQEDFADTEVARVAVEQVFNRGLNRAQRRRLKVLRSGTFLYVGDYTYATDEVGVDWGIEKKVDLTHLGFKNITNNYSTTPIH